jgi:tetratricopeptide (TPR) repeat protein
MNFKYIFLQFIVFLFSNFVIAENKTDDRVRKCDSLTQLIDKSNGVEKAHFLNQLSKLTNPNSPAEGYNYAFKALNIAEKFNDNKEIAEAFNYMAYSWLYRGQYDSALLLYQKCLKIYSQFDDRKGEGNALYSLGQVYYFKSDYFNALQYYSRALKIFTLLNQVDGLAKTVYDIGYIHYDHGRYDSALFYFRLGLNYTEGNADFNDVNNSLYNGIGNVFYEWGDFKKTIEYYTKALDLNILMNDKPGIAHTINNIGNVYYDSHNYDSARVNYIQALNIFVETENLTGQAITLHNLGLICDATKHWNEAISYYNKALEIYKDEKQPRGIAETLNEMGESCRKAGKYSEAIELVKQSQEYALEENLPEVIFDNYHILSTAYAKMGHYETALTYFQKYTIVKDSLFNEKMHQQINELETKYETEQKDKQITLLSNEKLLDDLKIRQSRFYIFGMGGFILLLILFGYILFRQNKLKSDQQAILLKQRLFRLQMNPHFIFNSLASIQNTIINEEPLKASKYLARFSKLVRNILDSSTKEMLLLSEEIQAIEHYLELQKFRFPEKFEYKINVDSNLDVENKFIPPMLAQPFIENAIEHGIRNKDTNGRIDIRFKLVNGNLVFEVEDDGVGRQRAGEILKEQNLGHKSMATTISIERIKALNRKGKKKISFDIIDLKDETEKPIGTIVRFQIPDIKS